MDEFTDYRKGSRINWGTKGEGLNLNQIKTGCLLRIADSLEKMEKPYLKTLDDLQYYREQYFKKRDESESLKKSNSALKGVITRMKNKQFKTINHE